MRKVLIVLLAASCAALFTASAFAGGAKESTAMPQAITFSVMASGTYDKAAATVKDSFKQGSGIDVTIAAFPWATLRQNNTTDLVTATGKYDIMSGSYYLADVYPNFISLDDYIAKYKFGGGLLSGLMQKCEFFGGHQIGLPYGPDAYGILYRKDLFDQAGLKWPTTWTGFVNMLPQLKQIADANGMATIAFAGGAPEQAPALFFDKYDGYFITKDKKYQLDTAKAVAVLAMDQTMLPYMASDFMGLSIDDANARFLSGKALMLIGWPSFVVASADDSSKSQVVGKWALGKSFSPGRPWLSLWQMYISKYSKNPEAAFKWAMALINAQNDKTFYQQYGIGPEYNSTYQDATLMQAHAHQFTAQQYNLSLAVNPPLSGEAQDFLASSLGDFALGKITAQQCVDQVNAKWATMTVPVGLIDDATKTGQIQQ
jgi:multiple sugar transport system substrate-binding protein